MKTTVSNSGVSFSDPHNDLINDCRRGDQKAQFQIYKLYYKAMYNTSLRIVNDTMEAEDIMQESFLTAFEKINSWSGTVSFGSWLRKIVQNRSIDSLRKKNKIKFEDIDSCKGVEESCSEGSYQIEEAEIKLSRVKELIKRLPEGCRNIFSLYLFEGYDHEEISEILSISSSTSRSQYFRAKSFVNREFRSHSFIASH